MLGAGQVPLERFGMTETGICISNPLQGERRIGTVGQPLPGLDIKLEGGTEGDIRVKGPQLFRCYWQKPEATAEAFDENGYFKTGTSGGDHRMYSKSSCVVLANVAAVALHT